MSEEICWRRDVSFHAYTQVGDDMTTYPVDSVPPIFMRYTGQFDYAATKPYPSSNDDCYVPIDEFEQFINHGFISEEIRGFLAAARASNAEIICVGWNEENETSKPYVENYINDGKLDSVYTGEIPSIDDFVKGVETGIDKHPNIIAILVEQPVGTDFLTIRASHYPLGRPVHSIELTVDVPGSSEVSPSAFAITPVGRSLINAVKASVVGA